MRSQRHRIPRWFAGLVLVAVVFAPFARDLHAAWHDHGDLAGQEFSAAAASERLREADPVQHCDLCKMLAQRLFAVPVAREPGPVFSHDPSPLRIQLRPLARTTPHYRSRGPPPIH